MIIPSGTMNGAISGAMQMITDNAGILFYVFGIPIFLISVYVLSGWINDIKRRNAGKSKKKDNIEYLYKDGHLAGGRKKK
jgi:hypothetical protein